MRALNIVIIITLLSLVACPVAAERIKAIVEILGVRSNPLVGYGIVVGLNGSGDDSLATRRAVARTLRRMGLAMEPADVPTKSVASVFITAELPPFGRKGSKIDVTVSTLGDATSLQGGILLMTPLSAADGQVYAVAQGPVSIAGFSATGESSSIVKNHTTTGRIPGGATVEREEIAEFVTRGAITLQLRNPDFATAQRIAEAINKHFIRSATALDSATVQVQLPRNLARSELIGFIEKARSFEVKVDSPALVVINERTGTIIVGENVSISTVAIMHGSLEIITQEKDFISQPTPFSRGGTTERVHRTELEVTEEAPPIYVKPKKVSVSELAKALNAMGLTPRDLISIFQALRQHGALQAELKII